MEYIIVFDPSQQHPSLEENSHYFLQTYPTYEEAKKEAEDWKANDPSLRYAIFALCSDERHTVV